jgi:hypothetical protein
MKEHQVTDNPDLSISVADGKTTKRIPLSRGLFATVDADDYEFLMKWKWYAKAGRRTIYALRAQRMPDGKVVGIYMHRVVLETPQGMDTDHIDCDGLNNTRGNLRIATNSQNQMNRSLRRGSASQFKGVYLRTGDPLKPWRAQIKANGHHIYLGIFVREDDAGAAYAAAAVKYFGGYARTSD